ncbi:ABC transporter substrate-binding protein [Ferrimicrobium sp.]|uniref:ABC transporter substrate-binding protein n=2 Tax=Ferrimicrobium sp. TaxID=2926050 RepID=UPI00260F38D5|nr:ABC transporter substrate-binding protein [Ferrimicrobium sp.]
MAATVTLGGAVLAACGSSSTSKSASTSPSSANSSVVTMAEGAQGTPDSILPFVEPAYNTLANKGSFQNFMWPALYSYGTATDPNALNTALSLANPPVFSNNNTVVTITLKRWKWSNGQPLTNADLVFFLDLLRYQKNQFADYVPGDIPDNIQSVTTSGTQTVVLHLTGSVNPVWFAKDQLDQLVPLPQQVWDKTSSSGAVGHNANTPAGAAAVLNYLSAQSKDTSTYATNPLWKVVDGPFELTSFNNTGAATFKVNPNYSGPKPTYKVFKEVPYTSDASEFSSLLAGNELQVGYVPSTDLATDSRVTAAGYKLMPTPFWEINFLSLNYISPQVGNIFKQLYVRQALQHLMNQNAVVKSLLSGTGGYPDYGPVPPQPSNPYVGSAEAASTYPYSIKDARALLTSHGWKIPASGAAVCASPGSGANQCGPGISAGQTLTFSLTYVSGASYLTGEMENFKSAAASAGIVINLTSAPFNALIAESGSPHASGPDIANWGAGFAWDFGEPYPTGGSIFASGHFLSYPVPSELRTLIAATHTASGSQAVNAMHAYSNYLSKQLPVIFQPVTYTTYAASNALQGVYFPPTGILYPQTWSYKK